MYSSKIQFFLADESDTAQFATQLAKWLDEERVCDKGWMIYLQGNLGAGKSFLTRSFIQYYLPKQKVKSPTYTLIESYDLLKCSLHHFDLYRLCDPEELEFLAIRDLLTPPFMAFVEWPDKGEGVLPSADMVLSLAPNLEKGDSARVLTLTLNSKQALENKGTLEALAHNLFKEG